MARLDELLSRPEMARVLFHLLRSEVEMREIDFAQLLRDRLWMASDSNAALIVDLIHRLDRQSALLYQLGLHDIRPEAELEEELRQEQLWHREEQELVGALEAGTDREAE